MGIGLNNFGVPALPGGLPFNLPGLPQLQVPDNLRGGGLQLGGDRSQVSASFSFAAASFSAASFENIDLGATVHAGGNHFASQADHFAYLDVRAFFMNVNISFFQAGTHAQTSQTETDPHAGGVTPPESHDAWTVGSGGIDGREFSSVGDPHETTGDGLKFDNMVTGTFTKLKSASGDFEVQSTQDKLPDAINKWGDAKFNLKTAVKSGNDVVAYDGTTRQLQINGQAVALDQLPKGLPGGGQVEALPGGGVKVTSAKGDVVNIQQKEPGYLDLSGAVGPNRKDGEVRGSLGAFDAGTDQGNEMLGRTGNTPMTDVNAFLEEWKVKPGEDLFAQAAGNPAGGGGPVGGATQTAFQQQAAAEFAKLDATGNGYLSGTEITAELKAAFPGKAQIFQAEFLAWRTAQMETAARNADAAEFDRRDTNKDGQLDGNEVGDAAAFDKGGNVVRPDGTSQVEISKEEFLAGRAAQRAVPVANPVANPAGGAAATTPVNPAGGAGATATADDIPAIANARKAKRKKRKMSFFKRLTRSFARMAGNVFRVAANFAFQPMRTAQAVAGGALNVVGGGNPLQAAQNVARTFDIFDGIKL